jgi:hypothetical protein
MTSDRVMLVIGQFRHKGTNSRRRTCAISSFDRRRLTCSAMNASQTAPKVFP